MRKGVKDLLTRMAKCNLIYVKKNMMPHVSKYSYYFADVTL